MSLSLLPILSLSLLQNSCHTVPCVCRVWVLITCEFLYVSLAALCAWSWCSHRCVLLLNFRRVICNFFCRNLVLWIDICVPSLEAASPFINASKRDFVILRLFISFCSLFCIFPTHVSCRRCVEILNKWWAQIRVTSSLIIPTVSITNRTNMSCGY